ncbi:MAG: hypothetical protein OEZ36_14340, partial [Spirochaetota bacterium]|nr:hypothetical protein [Spirochaetota bacterium]
GLRKVKHRLHLMIESDKSLSPLYIVSLHYYKRSFDSLTGLFDDFLGMDTVLTANFRAAITTNIDITAEYRSFFQKPGAVYQQSNLFSVGTYIIF